jgi:hypothetical protein
MPTQVSSSHHITINNSNNNKNNNNYNSSSSSSSSNISGTITSSTSTAKFNIYCDPPPPQLPLAIKPPLAVKPCYEKAVDRMQKNNMIVTGKCQGRIMMC